MVQQRSCWSSHHTVFGAFVHLPTLHRDFLTSPQNSPPTHTHHPHVVLHKRGQEPSLLLTASPRGWQLGWLVCTGPRKEALSYMLLHFPTVDTMPWKSTAVSYGRSLLYHDTQDTRRQVSSFRIPPWPTLLGAGAQEVSSSQLCWTKTFGIHSKMFSWKPKCKTLTFNWRCLVQYVLSQHSPLHQALGGVHLQKQNKAKQARTPI